MEGAAARYCVLGGGAACWDGVARDAAAGVEHLILSPLVPGEALGEQIGALAAALGLEAER